MPARFSNLLTAQTLPIRHLGGGPIMGDRGQLYTGLDLDWCHSYAEELAAQLIMPCRI